MRPPFRPKDSHRGPDTRPRPPQRPAGRYDAPGDPPLAIAETLGVGTAFDFGADLTRRLVRREVNPKEAFTVQDGAGAWYRASLKELAAAGQGGSAVAYERLTRSPEPTIELTLACAVLARQRMIFVAQKATELGVTRIVPLLTERAVPPSGLEHEKAHAWPGQLLRAAKQCRRSSLPLLSAPMTLDAALADPQIRAADLRVALDDGLDGADVVASAPRSVVLFVGPEGGFSDAERLELAESTRAWTLGGRVLRAETAVLVGLSAVHLTWGDFRPSA
jgi:16S rRNA (uracil1498-N3)-methyltransferase